MAAVEMKMHGLDELEAKLKKLGNIKLAKNAARRSARKAMVVVRDAAREKAKKIDDPETAERIWKNITISSGKTKDAHVIVMRVGVNGGAGANKYSKKIVLKERRKKGEEQKVVPKNTISLVGGDTRHFRYIELGTAHTPAQPFLRPALQQNLQNVIDKFAQVFMSELDKELAKL